jgi:uncharacterized protein (DUF736 family)
MSDKEYDNTNRGVLFVNTYKEDGDQRPDFTGSVDVEGTSYKLAGWKNSSKNGKRYISVRVSQDEGKEEKVPF